MFANNPQLQEQIRTMMPQMLAQLQNPEMQQMMSNPQVSFSALAQRKLSKLYLQRNSKVFSKPLTGFIMLITL